MTLQQKKSFLINLLFICAITLLIFFIIKYLFVWMFPFVLGLLVAVALQRPIDWLVKKTPVSRTIWAIGLVLFVLAILVTIIGVIGQRLYVEFMSFIKVLPSYAGPVSKALSDLNDRMLEFLDGMPAAVSDSIQQLPGNLLNSFASWASGFVSGLVNFVIQGGPAFIVTLIISIVACCFVTKDYYLITGFFKRQLSEKHINLISDAKQVFVSSILKMLRGYAFLMFITFVELTVGFLILKIDYAVIVALIVAIVDILPVLGTGTILIPWALISLIMGNYWFALGLAVMYVAILIIRNILEPRIIGKQVGLPPVVALVAMYLGLQLFGILGMFGVPVIVIILNSLQQSGKIKIWN